VRCFRCHLSVYWQTSSKQSSTSVYNYAESTLLYILELTLFYLIDLIVRTQKVVCVRLDGSAKQQHF